MNSHLMQEWAGVGVAGVREACLVRWTWTIQAGE